MHYYCNFTKCSAQEPLLYRVFPLWLIYIKHFLSKTLLCQCKFILGSLEHVVVIIRLNCSNSPYISFAFIYSLNVILFGNICKYVDNKCETKNEFTFNVD